MTLSPDDQALADRLRDQIHQRALAADFQTFLDHEAGRPTPPPGPRAAEPDDQLSLLEDAS